MKLFLDLEQTIIESWEDPRFINMSKLLQFFKAHGITEVTIFSFAIWNEHDKKVFADHIKPRIEEAFGVKVVAWPSTEDMRRKIFWKVRVEMDNTEFCSLWGKSRAFFDFCKSTGETNCVLIDDVVENETLSSRLLKTEFTTVNVDTI